MDPAWVTAALALAAAIIGLLAWFGRWAWRVLSRTTHFLDDYFGEPARDGVPARPGVMARLGALEGLVARVVAETTPNGGKSLRDVTGRIETDVARIKIDQAEIRRRMELFEAQRAAREENRP